MTKLNPYLTHAPLIPAKDIKPDGWVLCPNCKGKHALFYRRHSADKRTLNYLCDKIIRREVINKHGDMDHERLCPRRYCIGNNSMPEPIKAR